MPSPEQTRETHLRPRLRLRLIVAFVWTNVRHAAGAPARLLLRHSAYGGAPVAAAAVRSVTLEAAGGERVQCRRVFDARAPIKLALRWLLRREVAWRRHATRLLAEAQAAARAGDFLVLFFADGTVTRTAPHHRREGGSAALVGEACPPPPRVLCAVADGKVDVSERFREVWFPGVTRDQVMAYLEFRSRRRARHRAVKVLLSNFERIDF